MDESLLNGRDNITGGAAVKRNLKKKSQKDILRQRSTTYLIGLTRSASLSGKASAEETVP